MRKIQLKILLSSALTAAAFSASLPTSADETEKMHTAERLVEKGQLNKIAVLGMHLSVRRAVADGKESQNFLDCILTTGSEPFLRPIVSLYADSLSVPELRQALNFFETRAGQKYTAYTFWGTEKYAGFTPSTPPVTVTVEEKKEIDLFVSSPVGQKMTSTSSVLASNIQKETGKIIVPIVEKCRAEAKKS